MCGKDDKGALLCVVYSSKAHRYGILISVDKYFEIKVLLMLYLCFFIYIYIYVYKYASTTVYVLNA